MALRGPRDYTHWLLYFGALVCFATAIGLEYAQRQPHLYGKPLHAGPLPLVVTMGAFLVGCVYLVPAILVHRKYLRRNRPGHCQVCGFDMRGHENIPQPVCPECGTLYWRA